MAVFLAGSSIGALEIIAYTIVGVPYHNVKCTSKNYSNIQALTVRGCTSRQLLSSYLVVVVDCSQVEVVDKS